MYIKHTVSAKVLFGCLNFILFVLGFLEVVCGFLLLCDSQRILLSLLLASPEGDLTEPPFYYLALGLLALGVTVCAVASLGVWATYMPGYIVLTLYFVAVLSLAVCECAGGVAAAVWPRCAGLQSARGGALGALQAYYAVPEYEDFTAAVDLAQTKLQCCGMTSARNYDMSTWQLRRLGPRGMSVPLSCCVQPPHASHLNPLPLNLTVCQEIRLDPAARHASGCLSRLEDWYQSQFLVFMLALFVVVVFKLIILFSTVFSCIRLKKRRQNIHKLIKSTDMKRNENIYEQRMSGIHDEPITARYIQPNNFYSPRVRNPTIFHGKPNEMI